MIRWVAPPCLALLAACAAGDERTTPVALPHPAVRLTLPENRRDSAAVLDSLISFTTRVDADTANLLPTQRTLELGAGATGLLSAWRADSGWQRLHLDSRGAGFRSADTYWFQNARLVAARLETQRDGERAAVEHIWFSGPDLFRWTDRRGDTRSPEAQSTRTEVDMLQSRVRRLQDALSR